MTFGHNVAIKKLKSSESESITSTRPSSFTNLESLAHIIRNQPSSILKRPINVTSSTHVISTQMIEQSLDTTSSSEVVSVGEKRKATTTTTTTMIITPIAAALQALTSTCQVEVNVSDQRVYRQSRPNMIMTSSSTSEMMNVSMSAQMSESFDLDM